MLDLLERLRLRRWRVTAQRRAVAQVLPENAHLSAEQIFERARAVLPEISLATVYNTLHEMIGMGELREVSFGGGPTRYDTNVERAHQHLACLSCGQLVDVYPTGVDALELDETHGYSIVSTSILFQGHCPACAPEGPKPNPLPGQRAPAS